MSIIAGAAAVLLATLASGPRDSSASTVGCLTRLFEVVFGFFAGVVVEVYGGVYFTLLDVAKGVCGNKLMHCRP